MACSVRILASSADRDDGEAEMKSGVLMPFPFSPDVDEEISSGREILVSSFLESVLFVLRVPPLVLPALNCIKCCISVCSSIIFDSAGEGYSLALPPLLLLFPCVNSINRWISF